MHTWSTRDLREGRVQKCSLSLVRVALRPYETPAHKTLRDGTDHGGLLIVVQVLGHDVVDRPGVGGGKLRVPSRQKTKVCIGERSVEDTRCLHSRVRL